MATEATPGLRIFVSAPYDSALQPLLRSLRRAGIDAFVSSDIAPLGGDLIQSARSAIQAADLVLVVLTKRPALDPIFEAGMATALGKRLVLISEPGAALSPDLKNLVVVQAFLDDPAPVIAAVQEVARRPAPPLHLPARATGRPLDETTAARLLSQLQPGPLNEVSAIQIILEAIEGTGGIPVQSPLADQRWDIGVWSDDLAAIGGNPLIIEVKRHLNPATVEQVRRYMSVQQGASLGLVVYVDDAPADALPHLIPGAWFPVLVISLRDLLEQLSSKSFAQVIQSLRNRAVHGLPHR